MIRLVTAREQWERLRPWFIESSLPPDVPRLHWRSSNESGGEFDSKIRPASHTDVPHPQDVMTPKQYETWLRKKGGVLKDPVNDPWGILDNYHMNFQDMVDAKLGHYQNMTPEQAFNGRVWYRAFHDLTKQMAAGVKNNWQDPHGRVLSVFSALSPKTIWDKNIEHGVRFLNGWKGKKPYSGNPDERHDWQSANIHPAALARFREARTARGGNIIPSTARDFNMLANMHRGIKGFEDLDSPEGRAEWMENIRTRGAKKVLDRHMEQVTAAAKSKPKSPVFDETGAPMPVYGLNGEQVFNKRGKPLVLKYNPAKSFTSVGIPTLGTNIDTAKQVFDAPEDQYQDMLTGPKTQSFHKNGADPTPLREPREGVEDDDGYYELPLDDDGTPNWTLHPDQNSTIDTQDVRAITNPHGTPDHVLTDMGYVTPTWFTKPAIRGGVKYDLGYDLAHRVNWAATKRINELQQDPYKHIIPKQTQGGVWGKFKDDVDAARRRMRLPVRSSDPAAWWSQLPGWENRWQRMRSLRGGHRVAQLFNLGFGQNLWKNILENWKKTYFSSRGRHNPFRPTTLTAAKEEIDMRIVTAKEQLEESNFWIEAYEKEAARRQAEHERYALGMTPATSNYWQWANQVGTTVHPRSAEEYIQTHGIDPDEADEVRDWAEGMGQKALGPAKSRLFLHRLIGPH
jgi:hypothetical protein